MMAHPYKPVTDADGNPWVSPTLPSSGDEGIDLSMDDGLPTFDSIVDTTDMVQDSDDPLSHSDNGRIPAHDKPEFDYHMITDGQHLHPSDRNTTVATTSHEIDVEPREDPPGVCYIIILLFRV